MKPTLLILAAGMGSRYGGLKQLDQMGPSGETIMDYSVFDALRAGFGKVVFVIRKDFEDAFKERFIEKMRGHIEVDYVFQEMTDLPDGYCVPEGRTKPWGTNHAVWAARKAIREPFAVINADDFYGAHAYKVIADYLQTIANDSTRYAMVGYPVANTLSEHGTVNRGVCNVDDNNKLVSVTECEGIAKTDGVIGYKNENQFLQIADNARVSMNMWGFSPYYFDQTKTDFLAFLEEHGNEMKSEFYIPATVTNLIQSEGATVKVLDTSAKWFGVTYQEDKEQTTRRILQMVKDREYPVNLWS
ncbi:MAG: sugar phosphate nucleotidyltransferase [Salinivirgaceae bacterium]|jgi:NDP-sugar pyrophosphorylase family protein|nr:sugar phosphate nucleotidyltransferase [Salinivirgaceae bacterium]